MTNFKLEQNIYIRFASLRAGVVGRISYSMYDCNIYAFVINEIKSFFKVKVLQFLWSLTGKAHLQYARPQC